MIPSGELLPVLVFVVPILILVVAPGAAAAAELSLGLAAQVVQNVGNGLQVGHQQSDDRGGGEDQGDELQDGRVILHNKKTSITVAQTPLCMVVFYMKAGENTMGT